MYNHKSRPPSSLVTKLLVCAGLRTQGEEPGNEARGQVSTRTIAFGGGSMLMFGTILLTCGMMPSPLFLNSAPILLTIPHN